MEKKLWDSIKEKAFVYKEGPRDKKIEGFLKGIGWVCLLLGPIYIVDSLVPKNVNDSLPTLLACLLGFSLMGISSDQSKLEARIKILEDKVAEGQK